MLGKMVLVDSDCSLKNHCVVALSIVVLLQVVNKLKAFNSGLSANWISSLPGDRIFRKDGEG